ncbi:hypothetical protein CRE_25945 [Caenorhabditis remanei]|uniref:F-box domain-containing protein n=1 Tax=Caenorhabditis remanei TaxID=31234 RepID=E3NK17_CAERE|nr:hypothetical protein CRE_25945 [Caenorhabditis remanei]
MSEILKTNPSALHACIYYEFLREKNIDEAFKNFCETVGDNVIDYRDFEYWFCRFYHGELDFDPDRTIQSQKIADVLSNNPIALRSCILHEFFKGKKPFEIFRKLMKKLGNDFMDYPEFEFWYLRFAQGKYDFDYDRSFDPKTRLFTDLPLEVFNKIGEYLKFEDRLQLRDVSKDIRDYVDNWDPKVVILWYTNDDDWALYLKSRSNPYTACNFGTNHKNNSGFSRNPTYFIMNMLKHPKVQLKELEIIDEDDNWKKLIKELDESNRKLHVKEVTFPEYNNLLNIDLHFMIPGVLEEIHLYFGDSNREKILKAIESEQCQAAKMVYIRSWTDISTFPLDVLYNCPRFNLQLDGSADDLRANFLKTLMKKGNVQECVLYADSQIMNYFNEPKAMVPNFSALRRYQIPGTNDFYELDYQGDAIRLERKQ